MTWALLALWALLMIVVLAFFRGAQLASGSDGDAHQDDPGSTIAGSPVPTQPDGASAPPAPDFRRLD